MSALYPWLTGPMLAEMRRLEGSSISNRRPRSMAYENLFKDDFRRLDSLALDDILRRSWVNAISGGWCWLTEAGHKALAAIEAEERAESWASPAALEEFDKLPDTEREHIWSTLHDPKRDTVDEPIGYQVVATDGSFVTYISRVDGESIEDLESRARHEYDEGSGVVVTGIDPTRIDISKHGAIRFSEKGSVSEVDPVAEPNSSAPLTGWTRECPIEPGWYWLRSNLWVPEQRSTPVECVDADGRLEYVSNTGTHVVGLSEHWLWASMDSPPPEPPKDMA